MFTVKALENGQDRTAVLERRFERIVMRINEEHSALLWLEGSTRLKPGAAARTRARFEKASDARQERLSALRDRIAAISPKLASLRAVAARYGAVKGRHCVYDNSRGMGWRDA